MVCTAEEAALEDTGHQENGLAIKTGEDELILQVVMRSGQGRVSGARCEDSAWRGEPRLAWLDYC